MSGDQTETGAGSMSTTLPSPSVYDLVFDFDVAPLGSSTHPNACWMFAPQTCRGPSRKRTAPSDSASGQAGAGADAGRRPLPPRPSALDDALSSSSSSFSSRPPLPEAAAAAWPPTTPLPIPIRVLPEMSISTRAADHDITSTERATLQLKGGRFNLKSGSNASLVDTLLSDVLVDQPQQARPSICTTVREGIKLFEMGATFAGASSNEVSVRSPSFHHVATWANAIAANRDVIRSESLGRGAFLGGPPVMPSCRPDYYMTNSIPVNIKGDLGPVSRWIYSALLIKTGWRLYTEGGVQGVVGARSVRLWDGMSEWAPNAVANVFLQVICQMELLESVYGVLSDFDHLIIFEKQDPTTIAIHPPILTQRNRTERELNPLSALLWLLHRPLPDYASHPGWWVDRGRLPNTTRPRPDSSADGQGDTGATGRGGPGVSDGRYGGGRARVDDDGGGGGGGGGQAADRGFEESQSRTGSARGEPTSDTADLRHGSFTASGLEPHLESRIHQSTEESSTTTTTPTTTQRPVPLPSPPSSDRRSVRTQSPNTTEKNGHEPPRTKSIHQQCILLASDRWTPLTTCHFGLSDLLLHTVRHDIMWMSIPQHGFNLSRMSGCRVSSLCDFDPAESLAHAPPRPPSPCSPAESVSFELDSWLGRGSTWDCYSGIMTVCAPGTMRQRQQQHQPKRVVIKLLDPSTFALSPPDAIKIDDEYQYDTPRWAHWPLDRFKAVYGHSAHLMAFRSIVLDGKVDLGAVRQVTDRLLTEIQVCKMLNPCSVVPKSLGMYLLELSGTDRATGERVPRLEEEAVYVHVMEQCGDEVAEVIKLGDLSRDDIDAIKHSVIEAYETIHRMGVIHGDVAQRHIHLAESRVGGSDSDSRGRDKIKILDFDRARLMDGPGDREDAWAEMCRVYDMLDEW